MDAELAYKLGYSQALRDVQGKLCATPRFGDLDRYVIASVCRDFEIECEQTQHMQEASWGREK